MIAIVLGYPALVSLLLGLYQLHEDRCARSLCSSAGSATRAVLLS
jgi:hypothetical protein